MSDYKVRKWLEILDEKKLVQRIGSGPATKYAIRGFLSFEYLLNIGMLRHKICLIGI